MSTISLFYYLQVVKQMYLYEPDGAPSPDPLVGRPDRPNLRWRLSPASYLVTAVLTLGTVFIGVYATPLLTLADRAAAALQLG